ncbi:MAG: 4'-phosphopantetheinyl transferase superfamily protein, partial [Solirubrobacteraceae bacterium]
RDRLERSPALRAELFHPGEIACSDGQPSPIECLAGRFAAKDAVVKALGLDGFDPLDIEVVKGGERCSVRLHGAAAEPATQLGVEIADLDVALIRSGRSRSRESARDRPPVHVPARESSRRLF